MLQLTNLACGYGSAQVVHDLTMSVARGEIVGLLGPNGAGKSTTVMAIAGHVTQFSGAITWDGADLTRMGPAQRTRAGLGLVPEGRRIFADLTVAENLLVGGYVRSRQQARETEEEVLSLFPRLKERYAQIAGTLSGGEQQMLAIGRALMPRPELLMVDELSLGLMPAMVELCFDALEALKRRGVGCLLVEQNTQKALAHADRVYVLSAGQLIHSGTTDQMTDGADFLGQILRVAGLQTGDEDK